MKEIIVTQEDLKKMFLKDELIDSNDGWLYKNQEVDIIAIHKKEPKYLLDVAKTDLYKMRFKYS